MENYLKFLNYITNNLNKYFTDQAPYIKCKVGCAHCCSNGDYPFSKIEIELLKIGFSRLDEETKSSIIKNINNILDDKKKYKSSKLFTYKCPFLINNKCSVYDYRGIICRTFGLIYIKEGEKMKIPFCVHNGLNYSNVYDKDKDMLTTEKMNACGITTEPKAYNVHYDFLTSNKIEEMFNFQYGKKGTLIDLLAEDELFK